MIKTKKLVTYLVIVLVALICAVNYQLFIFPNRFAPAGLNGICTMIQYVSGISVGFMNLLINLPLAIWVYFSVSKPLALRSMVYVVTFSLALLILERIDLSAFAYDTDSSAILGPLVGGVINGFCYGQLLKASAYTGGTDFVAALIHKRHPDKSVLGLIFALNVCVAVSSYFVYDHQLEPVILCILYSFASNNLSERVIRSGRRAVRCEIVTDYPDSLSKQIIDRLHHSVTLLPGQGMYSGKKTSVLVCIINKTQAQELASIIRSFPHTFAVFSQVSEVMGNFRHLTRTGEEELELLDHGDGKAV